jgi:hypothetical protein
MTYAFRITLSLLSAFFIGACEDGPSTAPTAELAGAAAPSRERVPFKEEYRATGTIASSSRCATGTLLVSLDGGGTGTQLGQYTIANSHCVDFQTGAFTGGTLVKTAANGDQLLGTYSGFGTIISPPTPVGRFQVTGTVVITGGTGRFAGATGTQEMRGVQVIDFSQPSFPTEVTLQIEGTISSTGAER